MATYYPVQEQQQHKDEFQLASENQLMIAEFDQWNAAGVEHLQIPETEIDFANPTWIQSDMGDMAEQAAFAWNNTYYNTSTSQAINAQTWTMAPNPTTAVVQWKTADGHSLSEEAEFYLPEMCLCATAGNYLKQLWMKGKSFASAAPPEKIRNFFRNLESAEINKDLFQRAIPRQDFFGTPDPATIPAHFVPPQLPSIPRICVSDNGTLAIILSHAFLVEVTLNMNVRLCQIGGAAVSSSNSGSLMAIHHPAGQFLIGGDQQVFVDFPNGTKLRMLPDGIRYKPNLCFRGLVEGSERVHCRSCTEDGVVSYWNLKEDGLFWEQSDRSSPDPFNTFPPLLDQTIGVFFHNASVPVVEADAQLRKLIRGARVFPSENLLILDMGGMKIKQNLANGSTRVYLGNISLLLGESSGKIFLRFGERLSIKAHSNCRGSTSVSIDLGEDTITMSQKFDLTMTKAGRMAKFDNCGILLYLDNQLPAKQQSQI